MTFCAPLCVLPVQYVYSVAKVVYLGI